MVRWCKIETVILKELTQREKGSARHAGCEEVRNPLQCLHTDSVFTLEGIETETKLVKMVCTELCGGVHTASR